MNPIENTAETANTRILVISESKKRQMIVVQTTLPNGKKTSRTKHIRRVS